MTGHSPHSQPVGWGRSDELSGFDSGWHAHEEHQLLYASAGTLRVVLEDGTWLLPPRRFAWIPARTSHRVQTRRASLRTVYFVRDAIGDLPTVTGIYTMSSLAREMIIEGAMSFGYEDAGGELARSYFELMARLFVTRWRARRYRYELPVPSDEAVARAVAFVNADLRGATLDGAAKASFVSGRTLSRRFKKDVGMTWRAYVHMARMIEAMEQLVMGEPVLDVAFGVGFESPSAFTRAFKAFTGELPSEFAAEQP